MQYYILDLRKRQRVAVYPNLKQARKHLEQWVLGKHGPVRPYTYCLDDDRQPVRFVRSK